MGMKEFIDTLWWGRSSIEVVIRVTLVLIMLLGAGFYGITLLFSM